MDPLVIVKTNFNLSFKLNEDMMVNSCEIISVPILNQDSRDWKIIVTSVFTSLHKISFSISAKVAERPENDETYDEKCFYKFRLLNKNPYFESIRYKSGLVKELSGYLFDISHSFDVIDSPDGEILHGIRTLHFVLTLGTLNNEWFKFSTGYGPLSTFSWVLEDQIPTDVVIKTTGYNFFSHRNVLATSSKFFELMFTTDVKENRPSIVDWRGVYKNDTVEILLHYLYFGEDEELLSSTENAELIDLARLCQLDKLEELLETMMVDIVENSPDLRDSDLIELLVLADKYDLDRLKESTVEVFPTRFQEIKKSDAWMSLEPDLQLKLFNVILDVQHHAQIVRESE